jgi:16S rRNA (uracil1498-N3)-methyltransferase
VNIFIATIEDKTAILTPEESWHCVKVLRKKEGEAIRIIDGKGNFFDGVLDFVSEKKCTAAITSGPTSQTPRNYYLHLAIAPTKQIDRIEWMIEKCVEIGIDEISFIQCKNSERVNIKHERILKIVESAVKQSLQALIPKINDLVPFADFISKNKLDQNLIAHCFDSDKKSIKVMEFGNMKSLVMIGPEGDFTKEETELAEAKGFLSVDLGENRLRTETAGLFVCQVASILS